MVRLLVQKDLYAYKAKIFTFLLLFSVVGCLFHFRFYPWHVYLMGGYLAVSMISAMVFITERSKSVESLVCSLPVRRVQIILAKYVLALFLPLIGLALWYAAATIAEVMYIDARTRLHEIQHIKVLFMALMFFSIYFSILLPSFFGMRIIGLVIMTFVAHVAAILPIPLLFHPYRASYEAAVTGADIPLLIPVAVMVGLLPIASFFIAGRIYDRKDI
ncbi:ABC-2 transporter permease [candidate division KSB1 bacterium]|nr:ABC-2 transporter permease [candidate division KSB1 bacterium]